MPKDAKTPKFDAATAAIAAVLFCLIVSVIFGFAKGALQPALPHDPTRAEVEAWGMLFAPVKYVIFGFLALSTALAVWCIKYLIDFFGNRDSKNLRDK